MPRTARNTPGGFVYHVLNRGVARLPLFEKEGAYAAFERALKEAVERTQTRLLACCVMPDHWHLVVWPREDGELSRFAGWLTLTHTQRWHAHRRSTGSGHVYQGRFKSFPVQDDEHFLTVCRYVERNALRANLVRRAQQWRWCSLRRWRQGGVQEKALLSAWPLARWPGWVQRVNASQTEGELSALRRSVNRGCPFGETGWRDRVAPLLGLESTLRPRGRPRKQENSS